MALYTPNMYEFFKARTDRHIRFFDDCMFRLASKHIDHDHSKYREPELTGYVLLTWSKAYRDSYALDEGQQALVENAIRSHLTSNPHHPEYWDPLGYVNRQPINATEMDVLALQEMTCDWAAMSLEFGDNAAEFAKRNIGRRWLFNHEQESLIYTWLEKLDYRLEPAPPIPDLSQLAKQFDHQYNNHPVPEK